jgi:hypothetical protein
MVRPTPEMMIVKVSSSILTRRPIVRRGFMSLAFHPNVRDE